MHHNSVWKLDTYSGAQKRFFTSNEYKEAEQVTLASMDNTMCNTRKFRANTASAFFVFGWGRGNYAHFCRYEPIMT